MVWDVGCWVQGFEFRFRMQCAWALNPCAVGRPHCGGREKKRGVDKRIAEVNSQGTVVGVSKIAKCWERRTKIWAWVSGFQVSGFMLGISGGRLLVSGFRFRAAGIRYWVLRFQVLGFGG